MAPVNKGVSQALALLFRTVIDEGFVRSVTVTAFVVVATFVSELVVVCCVLCVVYSAVTCVLHDFGDLCLNRLILVTADLETGRHSRVSIFVL